MRIDNINKIVSELADNTVERDKLFRLLLKRDKFYLLSAHAGGVLCPVQEDQRIKIYTHQDLAQQVGESVKVTSLELCRLLRHWFCRGAAGLVVNEGEFQFTISIPEAMELFFTLVEAPPWPPEDVAIVEFYNQLCHQDGSDGVLVCGNAFRYAQPGEAKTPGWTAARIEDLCAAHENVILPEGLTVPGDRVQSVANYLSGLSDQAEDYDVPDLELIPDVVLKEDKAPPQPKDNHSLTLMDWRGWFKDLWSQHRKWILVGAALLAALLILCVVIASSSVSGFSKALDRGAYQEAQATYLKYSPAKQSKADEAIIQHLHVLLDQYAKDELTQEELSVKLAALQAFPSAEKELSAAYQVAEKLRASKEAYAAGETTYEKLSSWRSVIEADVGSYAKVCSDIEKNKKSYLAELEEEIGRYESYGLYGHAYRVAQVAAYWYPEGTSLVEELAQRTGLSVDTLASMEDRVCPVEIQEVRTSIPSLDSEVDLFISWSNQSSKTIEKITFWVTPINALGFDLEGVYKAVDTKHYGPGEGPVSSTWGWASAWKDGRVRSARITRVSVEFEGGGELIQNI